MLIPVTSATQEPRQTVVHRSRTLAVVLPTFLLALVVSVALWAVAARRPTPADLFAKPTPKTAESRGGRSSSDDPDDPERPIWAEKRAEVLSLGFAPNDELLAALVGTHKDWTRQYTPAAALRLILVNVKKRRVVWEIEPDCQPITFLFSPMGDAIAVPSRGIVALYDIGTGSKTREISVTRAGEYPCVAAIGFSHDGRNLAYLKHPKSPENRYAIELATGKEASYEAGEYIWRGGGISRNGQCYGWDGFPKFPELESLPAKYEPIPCLENHWALGRASMFADAALSDDGKMYAAIHFKGVLAVWDLGTMADGRAHLKLMKQGFNKCNAIAISHAKNRIAYASEEGSIKVAPLDLP